MLICALWSCPNLKTRGKAFTCVIWSRIEQGTLSSMERGTIAKESFIAHLPAGCLENKDPTHAATMKQFLLGQTQTVLHNCSLDLFQWISTFFLTASSRCAHIQRGYKEATLILCTSGLEGAKKRRRQTTRNLNATTLPLSLFSFARQKTEPALSMHNIHTTENFFTTMCDPYLLLEARL